MIQQIRKSIQKQKLFGAGDKILLAISGGMDSIVLLDIMIRLSVTIAVAHVNHSLRADESDEDERFVKNIASKYRLPYHSIKVDVKALAKATKANLSDVGHRVRYEFFTKMADLHGYDKIATAHHADDVVESFIMRSMEGAGLQGISGIPVSNGRVIRPLLHVHRKEISDYAERHELKYREDSSNRSLDYRRNAIRAVIRPALSKINPTADRGMRQSAGVTADAHQALTYLSEQFANSHFQLLGTSVRMPISSFQWDGGLSVLYYCLKGYGFNRSQVIQIREDHQPGALFYSVSHSLLVDRNDYVIEKIDKAAIGESVTIKVPDIYNMPGIGRLVMAKSSSTVIDSNPNVEYIPAAAVRFPLFIRPWLPGDRFRPIGMKGQTKSIQDFLVDKKIARTAKANIRLLVTEDDDVIWIIGQRLSHNYRIINEETTYLKLEFIPV